MKSAKSFIIISSTLMCIAFVWGIVDFAIAESTGLNRKLYKSNLENSTKDSSKDIEFTDFSRGEINPSEPPIKEEKSLVKSKASIELSTIEDEAFPRFSSMKFSKFSRAALIPEGKLEVENIVRFNTDTTIAIETDTVTGSTKDSLINKK
jgi:hypothetical protein